MLSSGEGFGPDHVGVSEISRQDLKPAAIVPDPRPVNADAVHCHLLASRGVRDLLTTAAPDFFGTGSARDVMRQRHVGRHSKVDLTGGIFGGWAPGTKVPPGIGTAR